MTPTCEVRDLAQALDEWRVERMGRAFETQSTRKTGCVNSPTRSVDFDFIFCYVSCEILGRHPLPTFEQTEGTL